MSGERRLRILAAMAANGGADMSTKRVCEACRDITGLSGAVVMMMSANTGMVSLCAAGGVTPSLGELESALGEGPCTDAFLSNRPVLEPDLLNPINPRWAAFSEPALATGTRAVFAFPMGIGSARLGAVGLQADQPGNLSDEQHADSLVMADVAAQAILALQADQPWTRPLPDFGGDGSLQYVVHQATGMVSAQLDISVSEALVRLRAHAFARQRPLVELAGDVVARRVRLDDATG